MKKTFLILVCALVLLVTGCGKKDYSKYEGVWKNNNSSVPDEELNIQSIKDDKIFFDYYLYRLTDFNGVEASLDGDKATFTAKNDLGWEIKGTIEFDDDMVILIIKSSSSDLITEDARTFKYKIDKSLIKDGDLVGPDVE